MADAKLKLIVVTPEKAVLDESAEAITLPLFDGELGVLPGRAALVGQLGPGELRFTAAGTTKRYFVESGFAQVRSDIVTVLTAKAVPVSEVTAAKASEALTKAEALPATNAAERATRTKAIDRARGMGRVAGKS